MAQPVVVSRGAQGIIRARKRQVSAVLIVTDSPQKNLTPSEVPPILRRPLPGPPPPAQARPRQGQRMLLPPRPPGIPLHLRPPRTTRRLPTHRRPPIRTSTRPPTRPRPTRPPTDARSRARPAGVRQDE